MLDLSPAKLLVIVIVAVILLGPDKLPQFARQIGATMKKLREFQGRVDQEVRENIPDLPSSAEIAKFARSPMTLINQWAESDHLVEDPAADAEVAADDAPWPMDPGEAAAETPAAEATGAHEVAGGGEAPAASEPAAELPVLDDPSMN